MTFRFSFSPPSAGDRTGGAEYEPLADEEDYECLVMRACDVLCATDAEFHIGGFGHPDWKFDIGYDMSTVLEQLPELIAGLRSGTSAHLDLYSQGVERTLSFVPDAELVRVTCISRTSWVPEPDEEVCDMRELLEMSVRLAIGFSQALDVWVPYIARLAPFAEWRRGDV